MKVPLSWLKEYVALDADPHEVASKLTAAGMKVEKVIRLGGDLEGVLVAEVLAINPHPDADKLVLVDVRTDAGERQVVCGAKNFAVGDHVPLAVPGSRLPGFPSFEAKKIRGVLSDGMLCSARDMGLAEDHSGILLLDPSSALGADVKDLLGMDDTIFELEITPNRPDAMSIIGIAREVAACYGGKISLPEPSFQEAEVRADSLVTIEVQDPEGCPRYLARVITGVKVSPSPPEVQRRLESAGVRPISNVVDATNYALLITGHPMHAFDLDRLRAKKITVRRAARGERLKTLDQVDRLLDADDLVIADAEVPVALAGVMGGLETEVSPATVDVLLESAYFSPKSVFRSSKRHAMRSEASARFERGADPGGLVFAADLATSLILRWAGGEVAQGAIDVYPSPIARNTVHLRPARARAVLGIAIPDEDMVAALDRLGLDPGRSGEEIVVVAPTRRQDIKIEEDLIEEVARVTGYDQIPSTIPAGSGRHGRIGPEEAFVRRLRRMFAGAGLFEARTNSLVGPDLLEKVGYSSPGTSAHPVSLANALTRDQSLLRPGLIPGLVEAVLRNLARRRTDVRLFEIGGCFTRSGADLPTEPLMAALVMAGGPASQWYEPGRRFDFFDAKGVVEGLLSALKVEARFVPAEVAGLHPTRTAEIRVDDTTLGIVGELTADALERCDVEVPIAIGEIDVRALMSKVGTSGGYEGSSRFPAVLLDLAIVVSEDTPADTVLDVAKGAGGDLLESVRLFDVYRGDQTGAGKKSLALSLWFRSPERTLTEAEALELRDVIASKLGTELGGTIRV